MGKSSQFSTSSTSLSSEALLAIVAIGQKATEIMNLT